MITSRANPVVARFKATASGKSAGLLLLDGVHLVSEALAAPIAIREAVIAANAAERDEIRSAIDELERRGSTVATASAPVMGAISPVRSSSPIVALADRPDGDATRVYRRSPALVVIAVDVQDPGNLGAIVRVAEAGGATGFVAAGASADPFGWKALRGSMGSALRLPIISKPDAANAVEQARHHGCRIVATVARDGRSLFEVDLKEPIAILIGSEGQGLTAALTADADEKVTIPMQSPVESLNAAVTAALVVYEARRQRIR